MTSVVTNDWRKLSLDLLIDDILSGTSRYYIGLAKSTDSDGSTVEPNSIYAQSQARHTLQSVKRLSNAAFVVPTVQWQQGEVYEPYTDRNYDQTNFYVLNQFNEVFVCVEQGIDDLGNVQLTGIQEPVASLAGNTGVTFETSDGYKWRYLYKISNLSYAKYKSDTFMPVSLITDAASSIPEEAEQLQLQNLATDGEIIRIEIEDAGSGYVTAPTITVVGNGDSASFSATIDDSDGFITRIMVDSDGAGNFLHGSGYDYASITVSGNAVLRPVLAPKGGLNNDPTKTLKARSLIMQVDVQADENGTLIAQNDFKQVVVLKDPTEFGSTTPFTANTGNALKSMDVSASTGKLENDELISGSVSTAVGRVLYHDETNNVVYYYQTDALGFTPFQVGDVIEGLTNGKTANVDALNDPDIDPYSGEMLYINNLASEVARESSQSEDIRIIIQLG